MTLVGSWRRYCVLVWGVLTLGVIVSGSHAATVATTHQIALHLANIDPIDSSASVLKREQPTALPTAATRYVTLTIGGDLGFGGSRQPVVASAGMRQGRRYPFAELTRHIKPLLKSDLAFANLESVVTDTNSLSANQKAFNFRMHPNGVAHLIKAGFNILSTANNHAIDYGSKGMRHTIRHLHALRPLGLLGVHGIAPTTDKMFTPVHFARRGASFAFAAAGIGGVRATSKSPGQASYRSSGDFNRITEALGQTRVDYRILSLHYGQELQVRPDSRSRKKLGGQAVAEHGVDLVIGHHAHTPAGVQRIGDKLVFYGLGNLLHLGMQDMGKHEDCRDFGLMARLHLVSDPNQGGRLKAQAIEIFALRDMHDGPSVRTGDAGRRRIDVINYLGSELTSATATGVRFMHRKDGSGLYCTPAAAGLGGAVSQLCTDWQAPEPPSSARRRRLAHACRYMRKQYPAATQVVKLRGSLSRKIKKKKSGLSGFARAAFNPDR